ncbi:MAG TPA: hypothetical protein VF487_06255 [Chitinophagaceae bacterium]
MKRIIYCFAVLTFVLIGFYMPAVKAQTATAVRLQVNENAVRLVYGKIYNQSRGNQYPASTKRVVLMPNTASNLSLAQDLYNLFDDNTIKNIPGARSVITSQEGIYQFEDVRTGDYIIRVTGMGGMVIKFTIPSNTYVRKQIPDMPADYYNKVMAKTRYIQKN